MSNDQPQATDFSDVGTLPMEEIDRLHREAARYRWLRNVTTAGLRALNWDYLDAEERDDLIDVWKERKNGL